MHKIAGTTNHAMQDKAMIFVTLLAFLHPTSQGTADKCFSSI